MMRNLVGSSGEGAGDTAAQLEETAAGLQEQINSIWQHLKTNFNDAPWLQNAPLPPSPPPEWEANVRGLPVGTPADRRVPLPEQPEGEAAAWAGGRRHLPALPPDTAARPGVSALPVDSAEGFGRVDPRTLNGLLARMGVGPFVEARATPSGGGGVGASRGGAGVASGEVHLRF